MSLSFPAGYSSNLGTAVRENYLVRIYNNLGNFLALSMEDTVVNSVQYYGVLKKAPTIRESVNIQETSSSLSNVTVEAVNWQYTASNQLDQELLFGDRHYINREVRIYSQLDNDSTEGNLLLLFKGRLKSVSSSNKVVTLDISPLNPLKDLMYPTAKTEDGLFSPVVFGDYTKQNTAFSHNSLFGISANTYPVEVATETAGNVWAIMPDAGSDAAAGSGILHYNESSLIRKGSAFTPSQLMAPFTSAEIRNNSGDSKPYVTAQSGTIYLRGTEADLERSIIIETINSSNDFTFSTLYSNSGSLTASDSANAGEGTQQYQKTYICEGLGKIEHTPSSLLFTNGLSYNLTLTRSGGASTGDFNFVKLTITLHWDDGTTDDIVHYNETESGLTASFNDTLFPNNVNLLTSTNANGNVPQKITGTLEVNYDAPDSGDSGSIALSGTVSVSPLKVTATTKIVTTDTTVQSDTNVKTNVKKLYSAQDGHQLSSALVEKPIVAHRYLLETFAPNSFTSGNRPAGYADLKEYFELSGSQGDMNYWQHKQEELQKGLKDLQHFGFFIGRFRSDGSYDYISPHFLTIDINSTNNSNGIYLTSKATTTTTSLSSLTLGVVGVGFSVGELICIKHSSGGTDQYDFRKVLTASSISTSNVDSGYNMGALDNNLTASADDTSFQVSDTSIPAVFSAGVVIKINSEKMLITSVSYVPSTSVVINVQRGYDGTTIAAHTADDVYIVQDSQDITAEVLEPFTTSEESIVSSTTIYTVTLPHSTIDKNDFSKIKVSHTPFDSLKTKWKINYHRDPASNSNYLQQVEYTNSTTRTNYNINNEDIEEIKNPYDKSGTLSLNYYNYYNNIVGEPRLEVSLDLINPEFFDLEVGDIFRVNPEPQNFFGENYLNVYFMVTQTTRTLGKFSISGYQII